MSIEPLNSEPTKIESDGGVPLVRAGLRGFLELGRFDVIAVIVLVLVAFGLRFASPIFPNFLSGGGTITALGVGYPTTQGSSAECTTVPIGPPGVEVSPTLDNARASMRGSWRRHDVTSAVLLVALTAPTT